ncbi:MAG: hypothetical protein V3S21_04865, partial [Xanthomonadales bacterium]
MVNLKSSSHFTAMQFVVACLVTMLSFAPKVFAQDTEFRGFVENATFVRAHGVGISKSRNTLQLELSKAFKPTGLFSEASFNVTFRGSYDAVYDLNDDEFGKNSGRSVSFA